MNKDERDFSLLELLKVMFGIGKKRKITFISITAIITLLAALFTILIYNPRKEYLNSTFTYDIAGLNTSGKYLNGEAFDYRNLISEDILEEVKSKDSKYSNIDIDTIIEEGALTISEAKDSNDNVIENTYSISIKAKYFKSEDLGKEYLTDLINYPYNKALDIIEDLDISSYLRIYNSSAYTYELKIETLKNQANYINSQYQTLLSLFGDIRLNITDNEISNLSLNEIALITSQQLEAIKFDLLLETVNTNGYIYNYDTYKADYEKELSYYTELKKDTDEKIEVIKAEIDRQASLSTNMTTVDSLNATLSQLLIESTNYSQEIADITLKLENGNSSNSVNFINELNTYYEILEENTKLLLDVSKELYQKDSNVYFESSQKITKDGSLSIFIALLVGIILGAVVAAIVNLSLDNKKLGHLNDNNDELVSNLETKEEKDEIKE